MFYASGLYGKRIVLIKSRLPDALIRTQAFNIILAAVFFFLVPVGIAPKTNLFIYLVVSLALIFLWRLVHLSALIEPRARMRAAAHCRAPKRDELVAEVNGNPRYQLLYSRSSTCGRRGFRGGFRRPSMAQLREVRAAYRRYRPGEVRRILPVLYRLARLERRYQLATSRTYTRKSSTASRCRACGTSGSSSRCVAGHAVVYAFAKRAIDIVGGVLMGIITIIATPFVWIALKAESPVRSSSYRSASGRAVRACARTSSAACEE